MTTDVKRMTIILLYGIFNAINYQFFKIISNIIVISCYS